MKKTAVIILAVVCLTASMLALSSCKGKDNGETTQFGETTNHSVYVGSMNAERADTVDKEIGRCEKNKKVVIKNNYNSSEELSVKYEVIFLVDNTGKNNYKLTYEYYQKKEDYESSLKYFEDIKEKPESSSDDELLIVTRTDNYKIITDEMAKKGTIEGCDTSAATLYKTIVDQVKADGKNEIIE